MTPASVHSPSVLPNLSIGGWGSSSKRRKSFLRFLVRVSPNVLQVTRFRIILSNKKDNGRTC